MVILKIVERFPILLMEGRITETTIERGSNDVKMK